jgi:hypothetical protein
MSLKYSWNDTNKGNLNYSVYSPFSTALSASSPSWTGLGKNPFLRRHICINRVIVFRVSWTDETFLIQKPQLYTYLKAYKDSFLFNFAAKCFLPSKTVISYTCSYYPVSEMIIFVKSQSD